MTFKILPHLNTLVPYFDLVSGIHIHIAIHLSSAESKISFQPIAFPKQSNQTNSHIYSPTIFFSTTSVSTFINGNSRLFGFHLKAPVQTFPNRLTSQLYLSLPIFSLSGSTPFSSPFKASQLFFQFQRKSIQFVLVSRWTFFDL